MHTSTHPTVLYQVPRRLTRRHVLGGGLALAGAGLLAACSSGTATQAASASAAAGGTLTIGLTYTPNIQFAPFYMALADGRYTSAVTLRNHGAQEGLFDALTAGTEHLVVAGADEAVVAASNGSDLVVVGGYYRDYPVEVIVPEDSAIQGLADLRGRTVGLPGHYGENWYGLQLALATAGLTQDDLTVQEIGYTQQSALMTGKVDAIIGYSNNDAVQLAQAGFPVRGIAVADDVPLVAASLVTTRAVLDARRDELAAAVAASAQGMTSFCDDPDRAVSVTEQYVPDLADATQAAHAREVAVATAALVRPTEDAVVGLVTVDEVSATIDFLTEHGLTGPTTVDAEDVCVPLLTA